MHNCSISGGGKFANGATTAAFLQATAEAADYFQRTAGGNATLSPGELHPEQPEAVLDANGRQMPSDRARDVIGLGRQFDGSWKDFVTQSGPLSAALNLVPGFNGGFARFHDWLFTSGTLPFNMVTNFGTMPYAMGVGYGAILGNATQGWQNNPMVWHQISRDPERDDRH